MTKREDMAQLKLWIDKDMKEYENLPTVYHRTRHKQNSISFQFWGWNIVLLPNGKWFWGDTSGG